MVEIIIIIQGDPVGSRDPVGSHPLLSDPGGVTSENLDPVGSLYSLRALRENKVSSPSP